MAKIVHYTSEDSSGVICRFKYLTKLPTRATCIRARLLTSVDGRNGMKNMKHCVGSIQL